MDKNSVKRNQRARRHRRVRKRVSGTRGCPRLCVFRSLKHIYAQVIDDDAGQTLLAVSSRNLDGALGGNVDAAGKVGRLLAEGAREKTIVRVVFDRGGYKYHGRVKALAEAARAGGLKF